MSTEQFKILTFGAIYNIEKTPDGAEIYATVGHFFRWSNNSIWRAIEYLSFHGNTATANRNLRLLKEFFKNNLTEDVYKDVYYTLDQKKNDLQCLHNILNELVGDLNYTYYSL